MAARSQSASRTSDAFSFFSGRDLYDETIREMEGVDRPTSFSAAPREPKPRRQKPRRQTSILGRKLIELEFDTYNDYLASSIWTTRRRRYFDEGGATACFVCDSSVNLNVHHTTYRNLGDERFCELVSLCRRCHKELHDSLKPRSWQLHDAHLLLKQSYSDQPRIQPPSNPPGSGRRRKNKLKRANLHRENERALEARISRSAKARAKDLRDHKYHESRQKQQETIRRSRELLGRRLTSSEVSAILAEFTT